MGDSSVLRIPCHQVNESFTPTGGIHRHLEGADLKSRPAPIGLAKGRSAFQAPPSRPDCSEVGFPHIEAKAGVALWLLPHGSKVSHRHNYCSSLLSGAGGISQAWRSESDEMVCLGWLEVRFSDIKPRSRRAKPELRLSQSGKSRPGLPREGRERAPAGISADLQRVDFYTECRLLHVDVSHDHMMLSARLIRSSRLIFVVSSWGDRWRENFRHLDALSFEHIRRPGDALRLQDISVSETPMR